MIWLLGLAALAFVSAVVVTVVNKIRKPDLKGPRTWRALGAAIAFLVVYVMVCGWLNLKPGANGNPLQYIVATCCVLAIFKTVRG